jgi:2-amino-4-hydroxy-6-hydroxymethyldihydropteridine diphosphokinase
MPSSEGDARVYVGLGGNLGDRLATLRWAVRAMQELPATRLVATSPIYETRPLGPSTEPFLNAAVELRTRLQPEGLLGTLLAIEALHGRKRLEKWEARTLDLDLLLFLRPTPSGWQAVRSGTKPLTLPHPRIVERDFVLVPLRDLVGHEAVLDGQTPEEWLARLDEGERTILRRVTDADGLLG